GVSFAETPGDGGGSEGGPPPGNGGNPGLVDNGHHTHHPGNGNGNGSDKGNRPNGNGNGSDKGNRHNGNGNGDGTTTPTFPTPPTRHLPRAPKPTVDVPAATLNLPTA